MNDPKSRSGAALASSTQKQTLVEEGTSLKGSMTSTCPILIQGSVEGDVEGPAITISSTGSLSGKITAGALKSDGKVAGNLDVDSAHVAGTVEKDTVIKANTIDLKLKANNGKIELTFGEAKKYS